MKSPLRVEVTETSIVVLGNTQFLTSIPLRRWSTMNGSTWSSQQRSRLDIEKLVSQLTEALQNELHGSIMNRLMRILAMEGNSGEALLRCPQKKTRIRGEMT